MRTFRRSPYALIAALAAGGISSAGAQVSVLSSTVEEREVAAGQTYTGRIVIANTSSTPQTVRIYQTDYSFKADGTSNFDDPGTTARSNASWITPQANRVVVPANSELSVPYSIKVPAVDSLNGTYWSAIMVEGAEAPPPPVAGRAGQAQVGIGSVIRYAVQVSTQIGQTGVRGVKFENPSAVKTPAGTASLEVDVLNAGTRAIRPVMSVELYDAQGVSRGKDKKQRGLLYPGTSFKQTFDFGQLPAGTYKAIIFADTGDPKVVALQITVTY
jgi:hypothetical protein